MGGISIDVIAYDRQKTASDTFYLCFLNRLHISLHFLIHVLMYVMSLLPIKPQLFQFDHLMIVASPFCPVGIQIHLK